MHMKKSREIILMFRPADEYGYFTDLRHPKMREEFEAFKVERKVPSRFPISDEDRHFFDLLMMNKYKAEWDFYLDFTQGGHYEGNSFIPSPIRLETYTVDSA